jgi:hypothetical protein
MTTVNDTLYRLARVVPAEAPIISVYVNTRASMTSISVRGCGYS